MEGNSGKTPAQNFPASGQKHKWKTPGIASSTRVDEGIPGHMRSEIPTPTSTPTEMKCRRKRCVRDRETEAEIMKVGETEATASVRTPGRTRRPQKVGPGASA